MSCATCSISGRGSLANQAAAITSNTMREGVPKSCMQDRVLLSAHGGGYVAGSMYTHRKVYAHVAKAIGCRALIVHYGRAPENVHPRPVNDMVRRYKWRLDQGIRR